MFLPKACHGYIKIMKTTSCHSLFCLLCACVFFSQGAFHHKQVKLSWGVCGANMTALSTNWEELLFESATAHSHILEKNLNSNINYPWNVDGCKIFFLHINGLPIWMTIWDTWYKIGCNFGQLITIRILILEFWILSLSSHALFPFSKPKPSKHGQLKFHWLLVSSKLMPRFKCHPQAKWRIADANASVPLLTWSNCG